jgi:protein-S-isoprenylcysteine O-methyltransferase Ste14
MNILTIINVVSNCTISFSAAALLIHIFGDPDNAVWGNHIKAWLAKFGLSIVVCGALSNVLTLSTPNVTEILLNVGMSITFFWLSWWQWEQFKKIKAAAKKPRKRRQVVKR